MTTLKKSSLDDDAISCLVVGLEHGQVAVVNPETFSVMINVRFMLIERLINLNGNPYNPK